jgi:hypothetical protein
MNIRMRIISLSIIALVILCALSSAAASTIKITTAAHSEYITDATAQQKTVLAIWLSNNTTKINESVYLLGILASGTPSAPSPIENARMTIQQLANETWIPIGSATTLAGDYSGMFVVSLTPRAIGSTSYRATYDGDGQFAPSVSNAVVLTVLADKEYGSCHCTSLFLSHCLS